ncbi:MAG: DUF1186 domain-containing protein, partial [Verrucomicrobiota bacterium]
ELIPLEDVEAEAQLEIEESMDRLRSEMELIENTEEAMAWWACFQPGGGEEEEGVEEADEPAAEPVEARREVGRNDPCPCGSQKKFKKC